METFVRIRKREGSWTIYSPLFKTLGYSTESEEKALEDYKIALNNFFQIHIERGTLEEALTKFGWKYNKPT